MSNMDTDIMFTQDYQSQYLQLGQKRQKASLEDLYMEKKNFFAQQITKDPTRSIKNNRDIKKPQIVGILPLS